MKKIKISPFSIIWLGALIYFKTPNLIPLSAAVAVHELGHIVASRALGIRLKSAELSMLGARLETACDPSYSDELILALGGPLFGFLGAAAVAFPAIKHASAPFCANFLLPFFVISLCLNIFNLIPISIFDGGRILKCLLCRRFSLDFAENILNACTFLSLFSLWLLAVYMLLKSATGLPMLVFSSIFFAKCFVFESKNGENKRF